MLELSIKNEKVIKAYTTKMFNMQKSSFTRYLRRWYGNLMIFLTRLITFRSEVSGFELKLSLFLSNTIWRLIKSLITLQTHQAEILIVCIFFFRKIWQ
jgi:hypothetical protein